MRDHLEAKEGPHDFSRNYWVSGVTVVARFGSPLFQRCLVPNLPHYEREFQWYLTAGSSITLHRQHINDPYMLNTNDSVASRGC